MTKTDGVLEAALAALREKNWRDAERHARSALRSRPTSGQALYVLARAVSDYGDDAEALRLYEEAIHYSPRLLACYHILSRAYQSMGRIDEAARLYRRWSEVQPENPEVQHMTAAVTGAEVPSKCSVNYIQTHFNTFSQDFDDVLVKNLAYKGPEVMRSHLSQYTSTASHALEVLDAGCGTGLCGPAVREYCRILTGVDLAEKMLDQARERGCYDNLVVCELCSFMESRKGAFDAIVSSDVLIYFGALERVIAAAHFTLRPGGILIYAVESLTDSGSEPYRLTASGRYAHRADYLRDVMCSAGLDVVSINDDFLRWERGKQVAFHVCVAAKPQHSPAEIETRTAS